MKPQRQSDNLPASICKVFFSLAFVFCLLMSAPLSAVSTKATVPGEPFSPHPTVTNLAVEWPISGDVNLNATVQVRYRIKGQVQWSEGMPLRRIPAGKSSDARMQFLWLDKLSGSIFDLRPGTEYEINLRLKDSDGGKAEHTITATTRKVPRPAADARMVYSNPPQMRKIALGLKPGDILVLSPGYYGDFQLQLDGEPDNPIVIRSDGSNEMVNSTFDSVDLRGRKHVILEGLTVNGSIDLVGARDVSVRYCTVNAKYGIIAKEAPGASNCYIADNTVSYVMPWTGIGMGCCLDDGGAACVGEGIQLTGPGNVIAYNRVKGYRDCISFMEDIPVYDQRCIDVYNNDIYVGADDGIEADFSQGNVRVMRNRLTNCFIGLSSQPGLGGPTYFIRNVMYNLISNPFKLSRNSKGDVVLHNTVVKVGDGFLLSHNPEHTLFRNNLVIGGQGGQPGGGQHGRFGSGSGLAISFRNFKASVDMDFDGLGTYGKPFRGMVGREKFDSIEQMRKVTTAKHAVQVSMDIFAANPDFPDPAIPERKPADLRLQAGSVAVDAGVAIPNVNNGYAGKAPDLGAYELGAPVPHYGPRPRGVDEETEWKD